MASPGKRRRKKMGNPAPVIVEEAPAAPAAPAAPKSTTKKKKKGFFDKD
tara:strand:- start:751 stop:897 length:147 start_codon:yes stop_codon:yes gene_type:complete